MCQARDTCANGPAEKSESPAEIQNGKGPRHEKRKNLIEPESKQSTHFFDAHDSAWISAAVIRFLRSRAAGVAHTV
jgi:hypothetical protein